MNDSGDVPSRTRLKLEAEALQAIGEKLVALPEAKLAQLPLPDKLLDALRSAREMHQRGAQRRQRQYIGRLMRDIDAQALRDALSGLEQQDADEHAVFHASEQWRDRMMKEGMPALETFFDSHRDADRQRLRQLLRAARAEEKSGKPPRHRRELFREIRRALEAGL